jgi:hypothetical protein
MKKDDRDAAPAVEIVESSSVGKVGLAVHRAASAHLYESRLGFVIWRSAEKFTFGLGLYAGRRVDAGRSDWFFGDPDPPGEITDSYEATGKEKPDHGNDAHDADIPAIGLREADAHACDLAPNDRADQRPALRGCRGGHNGAAI